MDVDGRHLVNRAICVAFAPKDHFVRFSFRGVVANELEML